MVVHTWSNWIGVQPLPNKKKDSLIKALKTILLEPPFKAIRQLISDGESGFLSKSLKEEVKKTLGTLG